MNKKRLGSLFLAGAMALSLAACGPRTETETQTPSADPTPSQAQTQTVTKTAQGFGGEVSVTVTDGVITDVTAVGEKETPNVGGMALEQLPAKIKEADRPRWTVWPAPAPASSWPPRPL